MASERTSKDAEPQTVTSVIGPDMKVRGQCRATGNLRIDGRIEGPIRSERSVVVTRTGVVEGDVSSREAVVAGTVRGNVQCEARVELEATGRFKGDLRAPVARIGDGATLNGLVEVGQTQGAAASAPRSQEAPARVRSAS